MRTIRINPDKVKGKIKPLHGVGGGPVSTNFRYDAREEFKAAGFPYARLHDIEHPYGAGEFVDIHCIFPDFDKDVNDPASYNFTFTDEYLKYIVSTGCEPFYRLGASIEHQPIKRFILPPKDFTKWGEICSHIIAHYNEGWADGFTMGITFWEIWNEPELKDQCFTGTDEELFELYVTAARIIKRDHPDVKIGGIANCTPYEPMAEHFLAWVREENAPLDFFSWHGYSATPERSADFARYARVLLEKYGFTDTLSIYDEWNYVVAWDDTIAASIACHRNAFGAAYVAGVLDELQKTPLDISMYYDAQVFNADWCGIFAPGPNMRHGSMSRVICEKTYYSLYNWNILYKLGSEIESQAEAPIYVCAARNGREIALLVSYFDDSKGYGIGRPEAETLTLDLGGIVPEAGEVWVTDSIRDHERLSMEGLTFTMAGNSAALVRLTLPEA